MKRLGKTIAIASMEEKILFFSLLELLFTGCQDCWESFQSNFFINSYIRSTWLTSRQILL